MGELNLTRKTGFLCDESYFWHNTGNGALFMPPGGWIESDAIRKTQTRNVVLRIY